MAPLPIKPFTASRRATQAPEIADKLAKEYALGLQEKYLRQKLKSPISLIESRNLRQQLNELTKLISLKLLS